MSGQSVGSIGPVEGLVEFTVELAPSSAQVSDKAVIVEHRGADGVTRLEWLGLDARGVTLPITLAPYFLHGGEPGKHAAERIEALEDLFTTGTVCPLFIGSAFFGDFLISDVRTTYKEPTRRYIDVELTLVEYDGSSLSRTDRGTGLASLVEQERARRYQGTVAGVAQYSRDNARRPI